MLYLLKLKSLSIEREREREREREVPKSFALPELYLSNKQKRWS